MLDVVHKGGRAVEMVKLSCKAGAMNITVDSPLKLATRKVRAVRQGRRGGLHHAYTEVRRLVGGCRMRGVILKFPGRVGGSVKRHTRGSLRFHSVLIHHAKLGIVV